MKLATDKKTVPSGQNVVKRFTIPSSKRKDPGLNQGILLTELFTAVQKETSKLKKQHGFQSMVPNNRQILFFTNVFPGDYIQVTCFAARRLDTLKITVSLQKFTADGELEVATAKFLYTVK